MSEPAAAAANAAVTDEELDKLLSERDEAEREAAMEAARTLAEGPCPVCGKDLEAGDLPGPLGSLSRRPPLRCIECGLKAPAAPSPVGWVVAMALAAALALGGMSSIFSAQRIDEPGRQKMVFFVGALLFGGGLFLGYGVQGAGNPKLLAQRILQRRRMRQADEAEGDTGEAGWFQENLEAVVVAIVLALIIRHFAMEAFVIPTGSMAPTLLGDHFQVACPNCTYGYPVSKKEGQFAFGPRSDLSASCPLCDESFKVDVTPGEVHGGHKILVNKFIYRAREPRRYEVIVFKFPEQPWKNYIKRLVGLPNDVLEIKNGDIWANGALARKPDHVQDSVWIPVHDAARRRLDRKPMWRPAAEGTEPPQVWAFDPDGAEVVCRPGLVEGAPPSWLVYKRDVEDSYGYNPGREVHASVADVRVRARVTAKPGSVVRLAVQESCRGEDAPRLVAGAFDFAKGTVAVEVGGKVEKSAQVSLPADRPLELAFCHADDRVRLQVGGATVLSWDDPFAPAGQTRNASVRVSAAGAEATLGRLRIDRDIHYLGHNWGSKTDPAEQPVTVPPDSYFAMGDNSPNSEDGRKWGFVHEGHLIGRAFLVFWPVSPFEVKFIR